MYIERNSITSLDVNLFDGLTGLNVLTLSYNELTTVPDDLFEDTTVLLYLSLNNNMISSLPEDTFDGLTSLRWLYLSDNNLSSLAANTFEDLTNMGNLYLGENMLSTLHADLFDGLGYLEILTLNDNGLTALPVTLFADLGDYLEQLVLADNSITTLPAMVFAGLTGLKGLDLSCNDLTALDLSRFDPFASSLTYLDITGNSFAPAPVEATVRAKLTNVANLYISEANTACLLPDEGGLSGLTVSAGTLKPAFAAPGVTSGYWVTVAHDATSIVISPTTIDPHAVVTSIPADADPNSDGIKVDLPIYWTTVNFKVTAEDGVSYLTYQVEVFREVPPATNARLTGLTLSGATIPESFDSGTYEYTATTSLATTTVTPELSDPDATAVIKLGGVTDVDGTVNLALGANVITVEVTAEDRTTRQTYTVTVTRQDTAAPTFVSATVNGTTLVMTFNEELGAAASLANGAFTVKKGSGGTEQTLSGSPSISGSTVTLTLATAVSATDTAVKVAYTKPTTGTANKVVDTFGNEAATFSDQDVGNLLADSIPPELAATDAAVLAADGLTLTLTYNEALKESSVPAASAFTVKATPAGGSEAEVALASSGGVTVSGSTVVLKPAVPIAHNDGSVKVRYDKPATGAVIEDANGNDAAGFPDRAVPNNSTAPRVSIEAVYADASSLIANPVFRVRRSNTGSTNLIVNVSRSQTANYVQSIDSTILIQSGQTEKEFTVYLDYPGNTNGDLTFTVEGGSGYAPAIAPNNAATVEVKAPASGLPVTVRQAQTSWTVEEGGTVDVAVTFTLAPGLAEPRDNFTVYLDPSDELAERGDDYVAYTDPEPRARAESGGWQPVSGGGKTQTATFAFESIQDTDVEANEIVLLQLSSQGIDAADFPVSPADRTTTISILDDDPLAVTDVEVTSTSTNSYYGVGDMIEFTVTFTAPVAAEATTQFAFQLGDAFQLGGATRQAARTGDEEEATAAQTFEYTVASTDPDDPDGISWGANALRLNGGSITFDAKEALIPRNADLAHSEQDALPGQKVDTMKPALEEAEVDEATLSLFFSEELNTTAPANTDFTVSVDGGTGANPTAVSISGSVVTLTLAAAVTQDQTATVSYAKPSTNPIKDLSGKEADSFTDRNVDPASDIANLLAAPGNRRVTLNWDNPNDTTIQRYQYRYKNTSDSGWNPDWRNISGSNANTTSFTATGLTNGIEYTFQVRPVFLQSGQDMQGKEGEVKSAPRGPLAAPRNLAATSAGDGEIALSWDDPSDITITGLPVPLPELVRQRLEPGLDGHRRQRRDDDLAHPERPDQQPALHPGGAGAARRHGRPVGPENPKAPRPSGRARQLQRGFRRRQAGDP